MTKRIYAIYDTKTSSYGMPLFLISDGEALRVVQDAVAKPGTTLADHPQDFRLDYLGEFDQETGRIIQEKNTPKHLMDVAQLVPVTK